MPMTQREMVKLLKKNGFHELPDDRGKGSHKMMNKKGLKRPITIPNGELKKGTERSILKEAGLVK